MENRPKCQCGNTSNSEGYCDGSHTNKQWNECKFKIDNNYCIVLLYNVDLQPILKLMESNTQLELSEKVNIKTEIFFSNL